MKKDFSHLKPPRFWQSLLWKLTMAVMVLTFSTLFVLTIANYLLGHVLLHFAYQGFWERRAVSTDVAAIASWMEAKPVNAAALRDWLDFYRERIKAKRKADFFETYGGLETYVADENAFYDLVIFDREGNVVTATEAGKTSFSAAEKPLADKILFQNADESKVIDGEGGKGVMFAAPIRNWKNEMVGGFLARERLPFSWGDMVIKSVHDYFVDLIGSTVALIGFGFILGFPVARHATRRLGKIALATETWSKGDFSARVDDAASDELGVLARRLNAMADDLRENFALRQIIATAEERNRIARDLHDSVKQQAFALALQIGSAKALLAREPAAAAAHLGESEKLAGQIQRELVDLIHELSLKKDPRGESFSGRVRRFLDDWSRQSGVAFELLQAEPPPLAPIVAQTFYRIIQEALANVARHSQATKVVVRFDRTPTGGVRISIADDGRGFDPKDAVGGFGLRNMRERAARLPNGRLTITSEIGAGVEIAVECAAQDEGGANE
jgi:NarL family two-component system sensor histidine kinase LiaS